MNEKAVRASIRKRLMEWKKTSPKGRGLKFVPYVGSVIGEGGTPDIIGCVEGKTFLMEVKRPEEFTKDGKVIQRAGKPTELQKQRMKEWTEAGAFVKVVYSATEAMDFVLSLLEVNNKKGVTNE